jgi:predicted RNase H-like nuclease (RuvC/YqgF family)
MGPRNTQENSSIPYRIGRLEDEVEEIETAHRTLAKEFLLLQVKIEQKLTELSERLNPFEVEVKETKKQKRDLIWKIVGYVAVAIAGAVMQHLFRISWIVQSSKISGGN